MKNSDKQFDTVIVGLGKTGFACARYLADRHVEFAVTDSRKDPPMLEAMRKQYPRIPLYLGGFDAGLLCNSNQLLISPGVSLREPAIANAMETGIKVCGDIELFCQEITAPVIAVTGSNGKSTVTTLIAEMARAAGLKVGLGGNIGLPALDLLHEGNFDVFILELSSFQLETVSSLNAFASVVLNVTEDHMDRYATLDDYAIAKSRIYSGDGTMVINLDDSNVVKMRRAGRKESGFTLTDPAGDVYGVRSYDNIRWLVKGGEKLIPVGKIRISGEHNIANSLAALALGEALKLPEEAMLKVLQTFAGLPHRCQLIKEINGVRWYDDSKGTNVGAASAAIRGLADNKNLILIAGGDSKGADFNSLADVAADHIRAAVVIGRDGPIIKRVLQNIVPVYDAGDMDSAVNKAANLAITGDVVLLSPACASFDMYKDYQARGDAFKKAVETLMSC
ncbi:MAG: UDP-N-acetylmuramoyl-L-alanine--D-glutamate ligase [Gammaproteobacteria bacterium]|nr:UDP-N-acetylmuramoyl-L-alanine--D-glutamate ligase [Gammaproteobacteria bacterium]